MPVPFKPPTNCFAVRVAAPVVAPTHVATTLDVLGSLTSCTLIVSEEVHVTELMTLLKTQPGIGDPSPVAAVAVNTCWLPGAAAI